MPTFSNDTLEALTGLPVAASMHDCIFRDIPALHYRPIDKSQYQQIRAEVMATISERRFRVISDKENQRVWEKGWNEVAEQLHSAKVADIETLKPQYFHHGVPLRLLGQYVIPETPYFEYYAGIAVRRQLMLNFLPECRALVELGSGTGINLLLAADLFPHASLTGSDWTQSSSDILTSLGHAKARTITPVLYNMLEKDGHEKLNITSETDVLTVHALEQLGDQASATITLLLAKMPRRCLHIEPILDFYDTADPFDDIARQYHLARGYLRGLLPCLQQLAQNGAIEILGQRRVKLGNLFHEAYSYVAWKPIQVSVQ